MSRWFEIDKDPTRHRNGTPQKCRSRNPRWPMARSEESHYRSAEGIGAVCRLFKEAGAAAKRRGEEEETMKRRKYTWDDAGVRYSIPGPSCRGNQRFISEKCTRVSSRFYNVFKKRQRGRARELKKRIGKSIDDREVDVLPCFVRVTFPDRRYRDGRSRGMQYHEQEGTAGWINAVWLRSREIHCFYVNRRIRERISAD